MNQITKKNIYIADIMIFDDIDGNMLISRDLKINNKFIFVVYVNGLYLDLRTEEKLTLLDRTDDIIYPPVYANIKYIINIYEARKIDNNFINVANIVYNNYLRNQELIKQKKMKLFPVKKLM